MAADAATFAGRPGPGDRTGSSSSYSRSSSSGCDSSKRKDSYSICLGGSEVGEALFVALTPAAPEVGTSKSEDASSSDTDSDGVSSADDSGSTDNEKDLPSQAAPSAAGGSLATAAARLAALRERRADVAEDLAALSEAPRKQRRRRPRQQPQQTDAAETEVASASGRTPTEPELMPYLRVAAARIHERNAMHPSLPKVRRS